MAEAGYEHAAIASKLAADIYGLDILMSDVEDETHNTTRFITLAKDPDDAEPEEGPQITTFIFRVRNVLAALYKALGGFATNGVNMTKLESQDRGHVQRHDVLRRHRGASGRAPGAARARGAVLLLSEVLLLGTYPASPYRAEAASRAAGPRG